MLHDMQGEAAASAGEAEPDPGSSQSSGAAASRRIGLEDEAASGPSGEDPCPSYADEC